MFERGLRARPGFWGTRVAATGSARTGPPGWVGSDVAVPGAIGSPAAGAAGAGRPGGGAQTEEDDERECDGAGRARAGVHAHDPLTPSLRLHGPVHIIRQMRGADGLRATRMVTIGGGAAAVLAAAWPAGAPAAAKRQRDVLVVSNNWAGTADVVDPRTFRRLARLNVVPDKAQR